MVTQAQYAADGTVTAGPIEGQTWQGITPESRFWPAVEAFVAGGGIIEPYEPPQPPQLRQTEMWRARAVARATPFGGGTLFDAIEEVINNIEDPLVAGAAREVWDRGTVFDLDGQMVPLIMAQIGMTEANVLPLIATAASLPA